MSSAGGGGGEKHETLLLRLDVGHESVLLAEPRTTFPTAHTHRWTVFVRGQDEGSLDPNLIQKVVFHLHDDFPNPKRAVSNPPFEITETGYGSFIIPIYILFAHTKREHYIEYDMNLKYAAHDKNKETKVLEFKDPKPELRARLLKAGAEVCSNRPAKVQSSNSSSSFQDLFGETLHLASPSTSTSNEKPKSATGLGAVKRQSVSPSTNGSAVKVKHVSGGKGSKAAISSTAASMVSQSRSPQDSDKKRRKSKDIGRPSIAPSKPGGKHVPYASFDEHRPFHNADANGAAQYALDASKLPPFVSPLSDGAYGGPVYPSTSTAGLDEQRYGDAMDNPTEYKVKKPSSKSRAKDGEKSKESSSTSRNTKRLPNGGIFEDKAKRKKTKSDSGLDSDYSSGMPNAHSPGVANGQHSGGAQDSHGGGSALFSPPDSVRSLDTLQESPASAASSSSAGSVASSSSRARKHNGCDDDHSAAGTSSSAATSDQERLRMLLLLQQKIMTIKERGVAQRVADFISSHASYELTSECLEFDLCSLDSDLIQRLLQLLDLKL